MLSERTMFEILNSDGTFRQEFNAVTPAMDWLVKKAREYNDGYVTWFAREADEPETIIVMSIAGIYYKLRDVSNFYAVEVDGKQMRIKADSLAALANLVRGKGKRIRVWSPAGIELIDTTFGDAYNLVSSPT